MDPAIERATNALKFVAQHVKNEDNFNSFADDWKYVAMVLDRILLWMFTIACVVGKCWKDPQNSQNPYNFFGEINVLGRML